MWEVSHTDKGGSDTRWPRYDKRPSCAQHPAASPVGSIINPVLKPLLPCPKHTPVHTQFWMVLDVYPEHRVRVLTPYMVMVGISLSIIYITYTEN